ncbi:serine hydrolase domain-containing protein [Corynebacterium pygosceleis]|uniref:Serine hydrolase n=1 Tax=Corynebacterium pygosceleis TaxID=2800406 RepID=A0A9Q4GIP6_9CORY|nr:serine hydrolase domain-containing protein [Corynebacterium pygosceleis]MCK7636561.1 beta-lactamase family protein [Corynebacterium pygosceleis]MCK7675135.1 beta-lactamase family protein [Corynebacterium pygosceleis]MCL0120648.1 beta-lactamase family protein [Corynebacterium pygosceleis]MCX7467314.1 serine hydrolase [Corynebacterium pygosceleis]
MQNSVPDILDSLGDWPVERVSAAVIDGGSVRTVGDSGRPHALASVTKLLSAWGVLMAVEEGIFELDSEVGPRGATVRQLLSHAGGVGFASREPERDPGTRRIYSSAGFDVLADVVAEESGMGFPEYLREGIFGPLGMDRTVLKGSAGHGAESTVGDLVVFAREILDPTLLHPDTVEEAMEVQFPDLDGIVPGYGMQKPCPWGLGFEIRGGKDPHWTGAGMPADTVGHFGQSGTYLWAHRRTGRAMVVLTDRDFGDWAKPLWADTNDAVWSGLAES